MSTFSCWLDQQTIRENINGTVRVCFASRRIPVGAQLPASLTPRPPNSTDSVPQSRSLGQTTRDFFFIFFLVVVTSIHIHFKTLWPPFLLGRTKTELSVCCCNACGPVPNVTTELALALHLRPRLRLYGRTCMATMSVSYKQPN